jgi:glycosyltransferase involved in cell wall biosynthesis
MSPLRVLYVIDSLAAGGSERSLAALAGPYRELGVDLEVAVLWNRPGLREQIESEGATVISLDPPGNRARRTARFAQLVRERKPDLVHTTLFEADLAGRVGARIAGVPVVTTLAAEAYGPEHLSETGIRRSRLLAAQSLDVLTARLATRLHAVSQQVKEAMGPRLHYPSARIDVVPRGRDDVALGRRTEARRAHARASLHARPDDELVLAVARQEPQKNLDVLVAAIAELVKTRPQAQLVIAGREGNATPQIKAAIERHHLGSSVQLLGARDDVPDLLCAADVFVLPSRREGMPGSVIEAMALEVPVVASGLPQTREVTADNALFAPIGEALPLARVIEASLANPGAAAERARRGRERFEEHFTIQQTSRAMVDFYLRALGDR